MHLKLQKFIDIVYTFVINSNALVECQNFGNFQLRFGPLRLYICLESSPRGSGFLIMRSVMIYLDDC